MKQDWQFLNTLVDHRDKQISELTRLIHDLLPLMDPERALPKLRAFKVKPLFHVEGKQGADTGDSPRHRSQDIYAHRD